MGRTSEIDVSRWRELRESAGLSLRMTQVRTGISYSTISRWETGTRTPSGEPRRRYEEFLATLEGGPQ